MKEAEINKTAIISRLKAYRERNGARAYRIVAHYVGSKRISDDVLLPLSATPTVFPMKRGCALMRRLMTLKRRRQ